MAAALPLLAGSVVHAQTTGVADVTPYVGVISAAEKASMRCGPTSSRYTVLEIKTGTPIIIDGEGNGWLRVRYPENTAAFVRAEDVSVSGDTATLVRASTLLAANLISGMDGSWQKLLNDPLPANSTLKVLEPVKDPTGPIIAYRVVAPEQARGFIESRQVRKATDAEAAPLRDKLPKPPATPAGTPATPATPPHHASARRTRATDPAATPSTPARTPQGIDLTQPDSNTDTPVTPAAAPGATPAAAPGAAPDGGAGVVAIDQSPSAATTPPAQPEVRVVDTVESLEAKFQSIWRQPLLSAEVDELISEFDRAIAAAEPGSSALRSLGSGAMLCSSERSSATASVPAKKPAQRSTAPRAPSKHSSRNSSAAASTPSWANFSPARCTTASVCPDVPAGLGRRRGCTHARLRQAR